MTACRKIDSEMLQDRVERAEYFPQKSYEALKPLMESEEITWLSDPDMGM